MKKTILPLIFSGFLLFTNGYSQSWDAPILVPTALEDGSVFYVENVGMDLKIATGGWWNTQTILKADGVKATARAKNSELWVFEFSSSSNTLFRADLNGNVFNDNNHDNQWNVQVRNSDIPTYTIQCPTTYGGYKSNEFLGTKGETESTNNGDAYLVKYNHDEVIYAQYIEWSFLNISLYEARLGLYEALNSAVSFPIDISQYEQIYLNSSIASEVNSATTSLNIEILTYKSNIATADNPVDFTSYIVNPSFESGFEGWNNVGMQTQTNNVFNIKHGNTFIEKWVNIGSTVADGGVEQTLISLPAGLYTLKVAAGNIQQMGSGSTQNSGTNPQTGVSFYVNTNNSYFNLEVNDVKEYSFDFLKQEGDITIGFLIDNATGNWVTCDNFRLEYKGSNGEDISSFITQNINIAEELINKHFQNSVKQELQSAITSGSDAVSATPLVTNDLLAANDNLIEAIKNSNISINAFSNLKSLIDDAVEAYGTGSGNEADVLNDVIVSAQNIYDDLDSSLQSVNDESVVLENAIFTYCLANAVGDAPIVVTNPNFARGAIAAFGRSTVTGSNVIERGFCWSKNPEPTVLDNRSSKTYNHNGIIYHIENLEPATVYYMRAYALTKDYAVGYGDVIKFATIPKGNVTYTLESSVINSGENYPRIKAAMESAIYYINNYTSISGHRLNVSYNAGTPTAEASYGGYLRFGPLANYQQTGTALHEFGHTIGVGQHTMWYGPNSPMRAGGTRGDWLGKRANKVVKFFENNPSAVLTGDNVHMWPYGINGAHEDTGSELLYMINSMIHQGLGEDGLPPTGGFLLPAYTFDCESSEKYYIKNESPLRGRNTAFLIENSLGRVVYEDMTPDEALENDYAAWNLIYEAKDGLYLFKNVASGKLFTYNSLGANGIGTIEKETPSSNEKFQLLKSNLLVTIGEGENKYSTYGYWIVHPEHKLNPATLSGSLNGLTATSAFSFATTASTQRWLLINENDMQLVKKALSPVTSVQNLKEDKVSIYSKDKVLYVDGSKVFDVAVYDILGNKIDFKEAVNGQYNCRLYNGVFIVQVNFNHGNCVRKVVVK